VTAAGSGIGLGAALRLAAEGADVTVWDRDAEALAAAQEDAAANGLTLHADALDMTEAAAIPAAMARLTDRTGGLDVLVNNIGGSLHTPFGFLDQTDADWDRVMQVNVTACIRTTRAALPHMVAQGYGRIVNLGSKAGRFGSLFAGANYVAAKGAMQAVTLQIAQEFGPHGITCNALCPGAILTPRVAGLLAERQTEEERARVLGTIPVRRHGRVEDIGAAVAYLASEEAGFVTGAMLDINGGQAMSI
jgi:NAD(P)-dependent dehydrogenase (short-subunit alcohol dehydrogenase family)